MAMEGKDLERLAVLETQFIGFEKTLTGIDGKLDKVLESKADKTEVAAQLALRDVLIAQLEEKVTKLQQVAEQNQQAERQAGQQEKTTNKQVWPAWVAIVLAVLTLVKDWIKH